MVTVVLVGPDGTGKSSVAQLLVEAAGPGAWREHYRPRRSRRGWPNRPPGGSPARSTAASIGKLALLWAEQWVAWLARRRRDPSALRVVERGYWDQAVDPARYRIPPGLGWLVRLLGRLLPPVELAVLLVAPAGVVHRRKAEITVQEIDRQLRRWRELLPSVARRAVVLDGTRPPAELARRVRELAGRP